jgi:glycine dehydrogenase subunit 2
VPLQPAQDLHDAARRRRPGAGPVGVKAHLEPFLPVPVVTKDGDEYALDWKRPRSIGKLQAFWGNFGMLVRAYTYIRTMGPDGSDPSPTTRS